MDGDRQPPEDPSRVVEAIPDWRKKLPPGYRFRPEDGELLRDYLKRKVDNEPILLKEISDVRLYDHNPETLTERYPRLGDRGWYFFTPRDRKYRNGLRPNRAAGTGFWKATGKDKHIEDENETNKEIIGFKKTLVFYQGKPPKGKKTLWVMHEFTLNRPRDSSNRSENMRLDDWVLCRIFEKDDNKSDKKKQEQKDETNSITASESPNSVENEINVGGATVEGYEGTPLVDNTRNVVKDHNLMGQEINSNYIDDGVMINNTSSYNEYYVQTQSQNVFAANHEKLLQLPLVDNSTNVGFQGYNDFQAMYGFMDQQENYPIGQPQDYIPTGINVINDRDKHLQTGIKQPKVQGCSAGSSDDQVKQVPNSSGFVPPSSSIGASYNDAATNNLSYNRSCHISWFSGF